MQFAADHLITVLEHLHDPVLLSSPDLRIAYANTAAQRFFGDKVTLPASAFIDAVFPCEDAERITSHGIPHAIVHGVWSSEAKALTQNGDWQAVRLSVVSHHSPEGALLYIAILIEGVTAEQQLFGELLTARNRFESLAANVPGAIFQYGIRSDGTDWVEYMSPGCFAIWEVSAEAIKASPAVLWEMIDPADLPAMQKSVMDSGEQLTPWQHSWRIHPSSGRLKWVEGRGIPIRRPDGSTLWNSLLLDITERKNTEELIENLVNYDLLTGLLNRRGFDSAFQQAELAAMRTEHSYGLLFIDIDNFKYLNDTLGHNAGDAALVQISQRLVSNSRPGDIVARLGGDEFVLLLPRMNPDSLATDAACLALQVLNAVREPIALDHHQFTLTCSIGIALMDPVMRSSRPDLLRWADLAMYKAKLEGRDQFRFFDAALQRHVQARVDMEQELRLAVAGLKSGKANPTLWLAFQPIVDAQKDTLGYEALLRWTRESGERIAPTDFIPIAEQTGLICDLGDWVLEHVCAILERWRLRDPFSTRQISVNISTIQIKQDNFTQNLRDLLLKYNVPAFRLKLELTETVMQHDMEDVVSKLYDLRDLGVEISLDDFGTGYSSLAYLHRLPFHELKIDRSFADTAPDRQANPVSHASVAGLIVQLGRALDLDVIAEGVETPSQLAWLQAIGCERFQGFLFGHPVALDKIEAAG